MVCALLGANLFHESYERLVHLSWGGFTVLGQDLNLHFFANDIFMVFFFGIAAQVITESVLPGWPA